MKSLAIQAAASVAAMKHGEQKYGNKPYTVHLAHVVEVLERFNITDEDMIVAAWLHDSVEDTDMTISQVEIMFGKRVGDLVHRVTNEPGKNRRERHEKTYGKILESDDAITLKLADRIANVEYSLESSDHDKVKMYLKEYEGFRGKLHKDGKHDAMWRHLDFLLNGNPRSGAW